MSDDMNETPHVTAIRNQWHLRRKTPQKFRVINGSVEIYESALPPRDLATVLSAAAAGEIRLHEERRVEKMEALVIGEPVDDTGVYFGTYELRDSEGNSLGKTFNLIAAPQDLANDQGVKTLYAYTGALARAAELQNWHGHNGEPFVDEEELRKALIDETYTGGWFIPTLDMLRNNNDNTQPDNFHAHRDKGALSGTFRLTAVDSGDRTDRYWSSTPHFRTADHMWNAKISDGMGDYSYKNNLQMSCRLVRLELKR